MVYVFYTINFIVTAPNPGLSLTGTAGGWQVNDSSQSELDVGDIIVQIGDLTYERYQADRRLVPFAGYRPGDTVPNIVTAEGQVVELQMPPVMAGDYLRRFISTAWFIPFWLAGTVVLLFLRPRDLAWRLLVAFMYLTGIWWLTGSISAWRVGGSRLILGASAILMVPIFLHLHLAVPTQLFPRASRILLPMLYVVAVMLAVLELAQQLPGLVVSMAHLLAVTGSYALIIYRLVRKAATPSEKIAGRLMLIGLGLGFGPGIATVLLPLVVSSSEASTLGISISLIAIPLLPFFYTYAIYKRQLGAIEFRISRLLAAYSFMMVYLTSFVAVLLIGEQQTESAGARTVYMLVASALFVLATPTILSRFQRGLNRVAYGTEHDPADLLKVFAKQIPSSLEREQLVALLTNEIMATLLIRQSALYLIANDQIVTLYSQNLADAERPSTVQELEPFEKTSGVYRPPREISPDPFGWVRLSVTLESRREVIGVWLFGRRDPDDFYPQKDIELLEALANQIAPVIENIRLYEALKAQASGLAQEVTRRTNELRQERDRTQAILDSAGEGIFFVDLQGTILYSNPALSQLSGYSAEELIGQTLTLWRSEGASDKAYRSMWTAIHNGLDWGGNLKLQQKDGRLRDVRLKLSPILTNDGQHSGFVGVQSDISKLKEVDRLKSNIISNVSHELKTPLTTIKTYLMLMKRGRAEKRDDYLEILNREANRLNEIIEGLLDLSSLDMGVIPSRKEPTSLPNLVADILVGFRARAASKGIVIESSLPEELPLVDADSGQISQVISNLLTNAINYSPQGGKVTITGGREELSGQSAVWIAISDTGPGISAKDRRHLFERFYRGQAAVATQMPGTGLGLAICKEIIERHNGKIAVTSDVGKGATFTIHLHQSQIEQPITTAAD